MSFWSLVLLSAGHQQPNLKPFVSPMFSDNMVLQRDAKDAIWGWTTPGQKVTVTIGDKKSNTTADANGKWMAKIGPFTAGGPYMVSISAIGVGTSIQTQTFSNVLFGDVWICSGQSNMEFGIMNGLNAQQEAAAANYPNIRLYMEPKQIALAPVAFSQSDWKVCTPENIQSDGGWGGFSAVAYFFGRQLFTDLNVPIGLIHTSWGGTPAEAWTDADLLGKRLSEYQPAVNQIISARQQNLADPYTPWYARNDAGIKASPAWFDPMLDTGDWKEMQVPDFFTAQPGFNNHQSVVWLRKEVDIPQAVDASTATLHFVADDNDTTWVNGVQVGATNGYNIGRAYPLKGILKAGRNVIVVRVTDTTAPGGIYGDPATDYLEIPGAAPISLAGTWKLKLGTVMGAKDPFPMAMNDNPNLPTVLYNGMIEPIAPLAVKGAIWYQGESNADRAYQYRTLLPTMIESWRHRFGQKFPFLIVQLAGFGGVKTTPGDDAWAELREAQWMTATKVPGAGIATAIDIGDSGDIHPKNKQEVGRRLALVAEKQVYGKSVESSGPVYKSMNVEGSTIRLTFDHASGLAVRGEGAPRYFQIAGTDHKWSWADAKIDGSSIVVSSADVPHPVAVRYSWGSYLESNLVNSAGLPMFPFRTDDWKGITQR